MKKILFVLLFFGVAALAKAQSKNFNDYLGNYKVDGAPFAELKVISENNKLMAEAEGVGKGELLETAKKDEFQEPNNNALIIFKRDASNNVVSVMISVQGMEFGGPKQANVLQEYVGKYIFEEGSAITEITVSIKNGKLFGESEQGAAELLSGVNKDSFEVSGYNGTAIFGRDDNAKISTVLLNVQGMNLKGKKQ